MDRKDTSTMRAPVADDELEQWAKFRADDAGHLARELITYRRNAASPTPGLKLQHADDLAVDRFASAMKEKLARKRKEGREGWDDKEDCSDLWLSTLLREHVEKGDPLDVGNFAMMLHQRGERICSLFECLQGE